MTKYLSQSGVLILCFSLSACAFLGRKSNAVIFKDKEGKSWIGPLGQHYNNGCLDSSGHYDMKLCSIKIQTVNDSPAQGACFQIGARLPSREDYVNLIKSFDHKSDGSPRLTDRGLTQMRETFNSELKDWFWSSTVNQKENEIAISFSGLHGFESHYEYRYKEMPVLCIRD